PREEAPRPAMSRCATPSPSPTPAQLSGWPAARSRTSTSTASQSSPESTAAPATSARQANEKHQERHRREDQEDPAQRELVLRPLLGHPPTSPHVRPHRFGRCCEIALPEHLPPSRARRSFELRVTALIGLVVRLRGGAAAYE